MRKRLFASVLMITLLLGCASAEFYTANEDMYYHGKNNCVAGSTYEISETAAVQFEKLACPVCVDRKSVGGEMLVLPLPQEMGFSSYGADIRDGKILVCGYTWEKEKSVPYLKIFDMEGKELDSLKGMDTGLISAARFLPDGRIAAVVVEEFPDQNDYSLVLIEGMRVSKILGKGGWLGFIHVSEDGFYVNGDPDFDDAARLAKFDLQGDLLWQTKDFAEGASAKGLIEGENGAIIYGYKDVHNEGSNGVLAVVDAHGNFVYASDADAKAVDRLNSDMLPLEGLVLVNGKEVLCEFANSIVPWGDGYLAAMYTLGPYVRIVQCSAEGKPVCDWFEEMGEINGSVRLQLMRDGGEVYLYVYGTTPRQLTGEDSWGIYGYTASQTIIKKLEVEE